MSHLIYSVIASLDGYIADEDGRFDWAEPDEAVHTFVNGLERTVGTHLYGRRMYETMLAWESPEVSTGQPPYIREFAEIWRAADKIVYSTTLEAASSARTKIERTFDPNAVHQLKRETERDILVGGPTLAAHAMEAGLIDQYHLFVAPVVVGGGLPAFPRRFRMSLKLADERRFANGMVYLRYAGAG
jgi:dihydrofolate reductase